MRSTVARRSNLWVIGRHVFTSLSTIALAFALVWGIARPHAQTFINETVKDSNFVNKQQLDVIDERLKRLEGKMLGVEGTLADQGIRQTRVETVLQNLEDLQREQRSDIKQILKSVKN